MTQRRKLLLVDEDLAIHRYLRRGLTREGYDIAAAPADRILARIDEVQPDVVLLDLTPSHAMSQIHAIKSRSPTPLIGLLPNEDTQAMIAALDADADDCIAKPFGIAALAACIRKVLRNDMLGRGKTPGFSSPTLRIDLVARRIYRGGRTLALSRRQLQVLQLLLDADGRVLTHRELLRAIWGPMDGGGIASLRKAIQDLRRKIEHDPKHPVHILSQARIGYRFDRSHH
jgi:two-component system KDP operon response regulator KdpE